MRILSKFKDYYDGLAIYGVDNTLVYDRKTFSQPLGWDFFRDYSKPPIEERIETNFNYYSSRNIVLNRKFLFIGGNYYSFFLACKYEKHARWFRTNELIYSTLIINKEQLREFGENEIGEEFFEPTNHYKENFDALAKLLVSVPTKVKKLPQLAPIFSIQRRSLFDKTIASDYEVVYNPCLKALGYTFLPAYKVHQDISMWVASNKEPPKIPEIDDLTMSEAKGFDKYSFRKDKRVK
jgi:hypothetical protein